MAGALAVRHFRARRSKTTDRVWPLFSQSHDAVKESDSYIWPVYTFKRTHSDPLDQQRTRILFYLYEKHGGKKTRRPAWTSGGWTCCRSSLITAIQRQQPPANPGAAGTGSAEQPWHRAQLVAAVVALGFGKQSQVRREQPVVFMEFVSPRKHANLQKMLAPVRSFPVSI